MSNAKTALDLDCGHLTKTGECATLAYNLPETTVPLVGVLPDRFMQQFGLEPDGIAALKIEMKKAPDGKVIVSVDSKIKGQHHTGDWGVLLKEITWKYQAYCELTPGDASPKQRAMLNKIDANLQKL